MLKGRCRLRNQQYLQNTAILYYIYIIYNIYIISLIKICSISYCVLGLQHLQSFICYTKSNDKVLRLTFYRKLIDYDSASEVFTTLLSWLYFTPCEVPQIISDLMLVTAVLNSCINPLIYGSHYHTELRQQESRLRLGRDLLLTLTVPCSAIFGRKNFDRL